MSKTKTLAEPTVCESCGEVFPKDQMFERFITAMLDPGQEPYPVYKCEPCHLEVQRELAEIEEAMGGTWEDFEAGDLPGWRD